MSTSTKQTVYEPIIASPVKSFFVSWLTRDISLEDAILDLLDNCVDGILRSNKKKDGPKPYEGFWAEIEFKKDLFSISDNCGGIPWRMHDYAFRMGRSINREPDAEDTVGTYGIGMKRAIFKIGRHCLISSQSETDRYEIDIPSTWFDNEDDWNLPVKKAKKEKAEDGTTIVIGNINRGITEQFNEDSVTFTSKLIGMISQHYAIIIEKGFTVKVNGKLIPPFAIRYIFDTNLATADRPAIRPFVFETKTDDGVDVFLTVGFYRDIPTDDEIEMENKQPQHSSEEAGWTVLCNDRAVVYCDRTLLTGWGDSGVPRYHTQFIAISGIVEFKSADPRKLPTTTTKRGLDASAPVYMQVKNKMREGMKIFTDYTNKWKGRESESKKQMQALPQLSLSEVKTATKELSFHLTTKSFPPGKQYMPVLPTPKVLKPTQARISFVRTLSDIRAVAEYFDEPNKKPNEIGEACFDFVLEEANK